MEPWVYLDEPTPLAELPPWDGNVEPFTHYVGYSVLGHVVLANPATSELGILYPLRNGAYKSYGTMPWAQFREQVLDDAGYRDYALPASFVAAVVEHAGPLRPGSVYYPVPYPFVGGSGAPETHDQGSFGVFMAIVGQLLGLSSRTV